MAALATALTSFSDNFHSGRGHVPLPPIPVPTPGVVVDVFSPPPPTPVKRQVSFADCIPGVSLEELKEFDTTDPPQLCNNKLTSQEYDSLKRTAQAYCDDGDEADIANGIEVVLTTPLKTPSKDTLPVLLVSLVYDCAKGGLFGTLCVANWQWKKHAFVRCSNDHWNTFCDTPATYSWTIHGYSGPSLDYFTFLVPVHRNMLALGERFELALCCEMGGEAHWDNNDGENYVAEVRKNC